MRYVQYTFVEYTRRLASAFIVIKCEGIIFETFFNDLIIPKRPPKTHFFLPPEHIISYYNL